MAVAGAAVWCSTWPVCGGSPATSGMFLAEAARRGVATCNTLLLQARAAASPAERLALLNAAVELDPRQAWAYYLRALHWFDEGEQARGLADLAAGNAAPECDFPLPWPLSAVARAPLAGAPPGGPAVCGWVVGSISPYYDGLGLSRDMLDYLMESLLCASLSGDLAGLEAWHQFACRIGGAPDANLDMWLVASMLDGALLKYIEQEWGGELLPEQRETLERIRGARYSYRAAARTGGAAPAAQELLPAFDPARGLPAALFLSERLQRRRLAASRALFTDLAQVHYPALALPACMLQYPALSRAEIRQRRESDSQ